MGADLIADTVAGVEPDRHGLRLGSGEALEYDALVLAVGGRHRTAFSRAITFSGDEYVSAFNGLLADLEEGWSRSVAFVVPPGTTWPLPIYELALMTAAEVRSMGIGDAKLEIVTPEATPLALFGPHAGEAVGAMLDDAGIAFRGSPTPSPARMPSSSSHRAASGSRPSASSRCRRWRGRSSSASRPTSTASSRSTSGVACADSRTCSPPVTGRRSRSSRAAWPARWPTRSPSSSRPARAPTSIPRRSGRSCAATS